MLEPWGNFMPVVQLGGLEPPTSCSTDRRSNQLSYNCIARADLKKGPRMGGKLGATPVFGKAARLPQGREAPDCGRFKGPATFTAATKSPGFRPGFSQRTKPGDQAAGL